mmetsp:Transcript_38432/g.76985  ORF Transcript_38432/g.76985 Transcript_38432/m.76985 type:complete len:274 (+) Transcript_38432:563-1384(+)
MLMGGRDHAFLSSIRADISTSALSAYSVSPGNLRMRQTSSEVSGSYFALPAAVTGVTLAVLGGSGIRTITLRPVTLLYWAFTFTLTSSRVRPSSFTMGSTWNGRLIFSETRYFMRMNSPSGGMNVTALSLSNLPSFTHWWKDTSSISMLPLSRRFPSPCIMSLSLSPNLHSGMPVRYVFITTSPVTSLRSTVPLLDMSRFTCSTTSRNTSFLRYLIPSRRHDTAPVTCAGARVAATRARAGSRAWPSCMMKVLRRSTEQLCGYPKSMVSSSSS